MTENPEDGAIVHKRLQQDIDEHNTQKGRAPIHLSVGHARSTAETPAVLDPLLSEADKAMFRVKRIRRATLDT